MFVAVCYDVGDDRIRRKVAKILEGLGKRVQKSVFECDIGEQQFAQLRQGMSRVGLKEGDLVRYYSLCRACKSKVEYTGGESPCERASHVVV